MRKNPKPGHDAWRLKGHSLTSRTDPCGPDGELWYIGREEVEPTDKLWGVRSKELSLGQQCPLLSGAECGAPTYGNGKCAFLESEKGYRGGFRNGRRDGRGVLHAASGAD
eukprot:SAG11_NODE_9597_length_897_cov_1.055138_1_plen_110_part_00